MKISELITLLKVYQKDLGDVPVFHQRDPEGNGFGTIHPRSLSYDDQTKVGTAVFIMPFDEYIEDELFESMF
jgi:hypothetical protein